ncbi:S1 family peptidase [Micromonospora sp. NPDC049559]|uniref:S1 family peptidase n=1 Tax=Micromonospora sp. NPDC049559 TaxID=3155923 RepID=UPI00341FE605
MRIARVLVAAGILGTLLTVPPAVPVVAAGHRSAAPPAPTIVDGGRAAVASVPVPGAVASGVAYAELRRSAGVPGTAWWTDPADGAVVVAVDATVAGAELDRVTATARRVGARLVREPGTLARRIAGGDPFYGGLPGGRCTVGFNVRQASTYYFLTSAHCVGAGGSTVYADPNGTVVLGVVAAVNPGYDHALVRYTNAAIPKPSAVNVPGVGLRPITSAAPGFVGQSVQRTGAATGLRSGTITGLNATVNYADGTVTGLIRTNVCAEPGDSGGPLFSGSTALGMTSGGSGNCTTGGTTYFSSASRAMSQYGVGVY